LHYSPPFYILYNNFVNNPYLSRKLKDYISQSLLFKLFIKMWRNESKRNRDGNMKKNKLKKLILKIHI